jgi:hypothetical protein
MTALTAPHPDWMRRGLCRYEREQLQVLPHAQIAPQRHPGRRVSVFFVDI